MPRKKPLTPKQEASLKWYKEVLAKTTSKKVAESYDKKRKRIREGEMIAFNYPNPKTPLKQLKWFDAHPLVILFNIKGRNFFGVNLHYMPRPMREIFLKLVIKINKAKIKSGNRFDLNWSEIQEFLRRNGLAEAVVKQYIPARMQNVEYVKYDQWKYAVSLPSEQFVFDGQYSIDDINKIQRRGAKRTRTAKNVRTGRKVK